MKTSFTVAPLKAILTAEMRFISIAGVWAINLSGEALSGRSKVIAERGSACFQESQTPLRRGTVVGSNVTLNIC